MMNTDRLCMSCMNKIGDEAICPICKHSTSEQNPANTLPVRSVLNDRYLVGRVLSINGESVIYIGWDNADDIAVYIREFFPAGIARRNPDRTVTMIADKKYAYNEGLLEFLSLNRKLASMVLPALNKTYTAFEENGTAYAISAAVSGKTLESFLAQNGGTLKWEQARSLFFPLMETISELHEAGIVHGGISPETIIIGRDGKLRLNGFSILKMRQRVSDYETHLFAGYAAAEQYAENGSATVQSDIYALSAVLFRVLIGTVPPAADNRMRRESLSVPYRFTNELPRQVLVAIANGLQLSLEKRTKTLEDFRNELVYGETAVKRTAAARPQRTAVSAKVDAGFNDEGNRGTRAAKQKKGHGVVVLLISALITALLCGVMGVLINNSLKKGNETTGDSAPTSAASSSSNESVSKETYTVPKLCGNNVSIHCSEVETDEKYAELRKKVKIVYQGVFDDRTPAGIICNQSVSANSKTPVGSELILTISLGKKEIDMPNLVGLSEREAWQRVQEAGLCNVEAVDNSDRNKPTGSVISQSVQAHTKVSPYQKIWFDVNAWEEPVDNGFDTE